MPSIKVLKTNGELVEEFELTEKYEGSWVADEAMSKACAGEGDIIELPSVDMIVTTSLSMGSKAFMLEGDNHNRGIKYTKPFDIKTARKSLLSRAIKGNE